MRRLTETRANIPQWQQVIRNKCCRPMGTVMAFDKEQNEQSIPAHFEQVVRQYPDRLAVRTKGQKLTYEALNKAANRVAHAILKRCSAEQETVALLLEYDMPLIVAMLGAWKAGKIWTRVAPSLPHARIAYMLEDSLAGLIVTNNAHLPFARTWDQDGRQLVNVDTLEPGGGDENLGLTIAPDAPAYIRYTSGSTGQPKGGMQTHRNFLHGIHASYVCTEDRVASLDPSLLGLFTGACLYPVHIKEEGLANVANLLMQEDITVYHSVATTFRHFVSTLTGDEAFPKLRLITLNGELVYKRDVELYKKHFSPHCIFINALATTETGLVAQYFVDQHTPITDSIVPVGYPVADKKVVLLDEAGREVGVNEAGEIAVRSQCLLGYWRRPELTRAAFLPDPEEGHKRIYRTGDLGRMLPDGCLVLLGRKDSQVKIRGNRVELAEIEMALLELAAVQEAVVVDREGVPGALASVPPPAGLHPDKRLVAYIVPAIQPPPTISTLRRALAEKLPDYMIPAAFVMLDTLPLTGTGKVDRRALPEPGQARPELDNAFVAPRTPVEKALAEIWAEALGLEQVGRHDSFLDLGGHSLLATQIISRVINVFQVDLPLRALFESPTVAAMSVIITQRQANKAEAADLERMLAELEALSDEQAQRLLGDAMASTGESDRLPGLPPGRVNRQETTQLTAEKGDRCI